MYITDIAGFKCHVPEELDCNLYLHDAPYIVKNPITSNRMIHPAYRNLPVFPVHQCPIGGVYRFDPRNVHWQ